MRSACLLRSSLVRLESASTSTGRCGVVWCVFVCARVCARVCTCDVCFCVTGPLILLHCQHTLRARSADRLIAHRAMQFALCATLFGRIQRVGLKVRSSLILAVFRKATVLNPDQKGDYSSGRITNMISSDCEVRVQIDQHARTCKHAHSCTSA